MSESLHAGTEIELLIASLGGMGDGVAEVRDAVIYVPFACPGDRVLAQINAVEKSYYRATIKEILQPSPIRQIPPCAHFGECGGCALQHINQQTYRNFKRETLRNVMQRLGYDPEKVCNLVAVEQGARRRAEFKVSMHKERVNVGFLARKSTRVIDIAMCPVTDSAITGLLPPLRECIASLKKPGNVKAISITNASKGLDVLLTTAAPLSASDQEKMAAFAQKHRILRLISQNVSRETCRIYEQNEIHAVFGGIPVELPARAFLQATEKGQQVITDFILKHLDGFRSIADIYSGCGTYSFPLVQAGHRVTAYEGDIDMVTAMHNAIHRHGLEHKISAHIRDIFRSPLTAMELKRFDAIVINPPRNGALPQAERLAESGSRRIVMVSCNPATFARDAACLKASGYDLLEAIPIDQFLWSHHLELAAAFSRS